jgi:PAS domain-containing protein
MLGYSVVGFLAVVSTGATATLVARRRSAPTATPLLGVCLLLVAVAVSSVAVATPSPVRAAVVGVTGARPPDDLWIALTLALALPANGLWLLFAVRHTGRGSRSRRRVTALVVVAVGACYVAPAYALLGPGAVVGDPAVTAVANALATGLFFTSALASLGSLFVLEAALRRNAVPPGEGLTLAAGASLFAYAPIVAYNLDQPATVPAMLVGASLLLAIAVERYPVFEALPVARIAARDSLVEGTDDAVVLADEAGRVVELNPAAASLLGVPPAGADRRPLEAVVPQAPAPATLAAVDEPHRLERDGQYLEVTASAVADEFGRSVGYLLVVRNVTEQERRERRLRLLTRFLASTVGDRTAAVARRATQLTNEAGDAADGSTSPPDPAVLAGEIRRTTGALQRLVAATRRVERALSGRGAGPSDVVAVIRDVVAERDRATLTVATDCPWTNATAPVDPAVLRAVVDLLLEDWSSHHHGHGVRVVVRRPQESETTITLRADGPPAADEGAPRAGASRLADEEASTVALSRLALEHAGGQVERVPDGWICIHLPTKSAATATPSAGDRPDAGTSSAPPRGTGQTSDSP